MTKGSNGNSLQTGFEQTSEKLNRADADTKGGIKRKRKFSQKVMVWLAACSKGITPLTIEVGTNWPMLWTGAKSNQKQH
ncbi:unnamed protein product [Adineta ricciae]|uniref:Uncharacterized protein n=1 Tax=Adineta ricciae TaxID=249248 RepID=A0A815SGT0_ADIRI|nr:unnamed protein product [Adineta ricciae]CAF1490456.1 unnamed protein product [Adineta ricciae]